MTLEEDRAAKVKRRDLIVHMLHELETPYKQLTEWELTFLESVRGTFEDRARLTDRQFEVLERIYAEKTA